MRRLLARLDNSSGTNHLREFLGQFLAQMQPTAESSSRVVKQANLDLAGLEDEEDGLSS
ncbi:MAG: hypothetical protein AB1486_35275 [Planctomycetota bacterium]